MSCMRTGAPASFDVSAAALADSDALWPEPNELAPS